MKRKLACLLLCCLAPLLQSCSTTRLGYDHLDSVLHWILSDYADLQAPQQQLWDRDFPPLWQWHRKTQLPLYAADLRQLAGEVRAGPLGFEQLQGYGNRITGYWNTAVEHALPAFAALNASFSDAQVAEMVRRIGAKIDKKGHKRDQYSDAERRERLTNETSDLFDDWLGSVTPAQHQLVAQWVAQVNLIGPRDTADQHRLLAQYAELLKSRDQPGFQAGLHDLLLKRDDSDPPPSRDPAERDKWFKLLADVSATLEPQQRRYLSDKLLGYAKDFEALAAEPVEAKQGDAKSESSGG